MPAPKSAIAPSALAPSALALSAALLAGLSAAAFLLAPAAEAHHGWGSYDAANPLSITAPVEHLDWSNPHAHLRLSHRGEVWEATLAPLSRMQLRGLTPEMLTPGATVTVEGYPSTRTPRELRAERIIAAGKTVELR